MAENRYLHNYLVFDFETGGLHCKKNLALEFAGIWINGETFEEIDRYESLILPYSDDLTITEKALEKNGIQLEEIAEKGIDVSEVVASIVAKTEKANKDKSRGIKTMLVGQNVIFDIGFLKQIFSLNKTDLKIFAGSEGFNDYELFYFDTEKLGRIRNSKEARFTLTHLCQYDNIDLIGAHRAMNDVISTKDLFVTYMNALKGNSSDVDLSSSVRKKFSFQI